MSVPLAARQGSRATTRQAWADRLARFATAGLSVADFCRSEGVSYQSFCYWRQKLAGSPAGAPDGPRLLPVRLLAGPAPVEVVLPSGCVLRLPVGCDLAFVRSLV